MGLQQFSIPYKNSVWPHYFLCNYLPVSVGQDTLSLSLLNFKRNRQPDLAAWIDCSLEMLSASLILPGTIVVRALHHQETEISASNSTALDQLGLALASHLHGRYLPRLLHKSQPTREIKWFSKGQREMELIGLYQIQESMLRESLNEFPNPDSPHPIIPSASISQPFLSGPQSARPSISIPKSQSARPSFLIIDDILTTGTTVKMIIGLLNGYFPSAQLSIYTLAKADYDHNLNKSAPLKGQNYQLEEGTGWTVSEEQAGYDSPNQDYFSLNKLKCHIRANSFPRLSSIAPQFPVYQECSYTALTFQKLLLNNV